MRIASEVRSGRHLRRSTEVRRAQSRSSPKEQWIDGAIKFFREHSGYGFIVSESLSADVFLHITLLQEKRIRLEDLIKNKKIQFTCAEKPDGKLIATDVRLP